MILLLQDTEVFMDINYATVEIEEAEDDIKVTLSLKNYFNTNV